MAKMYFLARIKDKSSATIDRAFFIWPPSQYKDQHGVLEGLSDDMVFIASKVKIGRFKYECEAPGFGEPGNYGNGSVLAGDVEILTPASLVRPTEEDRLKLNPIGDD